MSDADVRSNDEHDMKVKQRRMWASGDYPAVASEVIPQLGIELVRACDLKSGDRVLDVAAGSGNASIPAAVGGAHVVAADLTPELFERGRAIADEQGVEVEWREADAESLPFDTADFDAVISCVGVMFAPHHQLTADELVRVCRPGGTIGLCNWTPEGFIGQMFAAMKPYAPAPPPGAQPPPLWGDEEHVRSLFGSRIADVRAERRLLHVDRFGSGEEFRKFFVEHYGPTISVYAAIGDDRERAQALDRALIALGDEELGHGGAGMDWEYLLVTARKV